MLSLRRDCPRLRCTSRTSTGEKNFANIHTSPARRWVRSRDLACRVICWGSEPQQNYFEPIALFQKQRSGIKTFLAHFINQRLPLAFELINLISEIAQLFLLLRVGRRCIKRKRRRASIPSSFESLRPVLRISQPG